MKLALSNRIPYMYVKLSCYPLVGERRPISSGRHCLTNDALKTICALSGVVSCVITVVTSLVRKGIKCRRAILWATQLRTLAG